MPLLILLFLLICGITVGFLLLNVGAKLITDNAVLIARKSGYGEIVVGILVVSVLAALPEILISLFALGEKSPSLALGNALGSHIVNISLIIGISAMITPLICTRTLIFRDAIFLVIITLVSTLFIIDGSLTGYEGMVLILLFIPYAINLLSQKKSYTPQKVREMLDKIEIELILIGQISGKKIMVRGGKGWFLIGIGLAVGSAYVVTKCAIGMAECIGIEEWYIGITIVAIGASMPDILAGYHAAKQGHTELSLAIGIGANIFTMLLTLGLMGLCFPIENIELENMKVILFGMNIVCFLLLIFMISGENITKTEGIVLFSVYLICIVMSCAIYKL